MLKDEYIKDSARVIYGRVPADSFEGREEERVTVRALMSLDALVTEIGLDALAELVTRYKKRLSEYKDFYELKVPESLMTSLRSASHMDRLTGTTELARNIVDNNWFLGISVENRESIWLSLAGMAGNFARPMLFETSYAELVAALDAVNVKLV